MTRKFPHENIIRGKGLLCLRRLSCGLLVILLFTGLGGCHSSNPPAKNQTPKSQLDTQGTELVLNNAILEQSNKRENTVWKIKADNIVYSEDKKNAVLDKMVGNLLQNDKIILQISAKNGEVQDNGNVIILKEDVLASDPRNQGLIESSLVEWQPRKNLLLIKDGLKAIHPNLEVIAKSGRYFTDRENLELQGDVIATTNKPALQLKSDRLEWNIAQDKITSSGPIKVVRYNENEKVTDRLVSDRAEVDLVKNVATLNKNIEIISLQPNLQAATEFLTWDYQNRIGKTDRPIQILDRDRQISLTGNKGEINLQQQTAKLQNGVQGINQQKRSQLYANQLIWEVATEKIAATGNVVYEQADPQARLMGEKAVGTLSDNNIVVTSDGKKQVTSIINN